MDTLLYLLTATTLLTIAATITVIYYILNVYYPLLQKCHDEIDYLIHDIENMAMRVENAENKEDIYLHLATLNNELVRLKLKR